MPSAAPFRWTAPLIVAAAACLASCGDGGGERGTAAQSVSEPAGAPRSDHKNTEYTIGGRTIWLIDGVAEVAAAPGSAARIVTRYFGNEVRGDFNADGREDVLFLVTQETGGSGTFFYAVAAVNLER
ncbi:MAG: hypothetical protein EHM50_01115, partial [Lysobacterales bacterium]